MQDAKYYREYRVKNKNKINTRRRLLYNFRKSNKKHCKQCSVRFAVTGKSICKTCQRKNNGVSDNHIAYQVAYHSGLPLEAEDIPQYLINYYRLKININKQTKGVKNG